jgi:hypothetical protein
MKCAGTALETNTTDVSIQNSLREIMWSSLILKLVGEGFLFYATSRLKSQIKNKATDKCAVFAQFSLLGAGEMMVVLPGG